MALDLQDQEELENAKRAWKLWGRWVFLAMLIAAAVYLGNIVWKGQVEKRNAAAAAVFDSEFAAALNKGDNANALKAVQKIQTEYPNTFAATQATLALADDAFVNGKYDDAAGHLKWLLQTQKHPMIRAAVVQRLATVYLQQEKFDDALRVLNEKLEPEFAGRIAELKGDIYLAQGKANEAKQAFTTALQQLPQDDPSRELVEMKSKL
ncbi:MAG: tetratricopeptide repeat protein [Neisseriaceae bacterium]|nr:tetratricopeptide repeat protein [Neisseriaceae bacterium]